MIKKKKDLGDEEGEGVLGAHPRFSHRNHSRQHPQPQRVAQPVDCHAQESCSERGGRQHRRKERERERERERARARERERARKPGEVPSFYLTRAGRLFSS